MDGLSVAQWVLREANLGSECLISLLDGDFNGDDAFAYASGLDIFLLDGSYRFRAKLDFLSAFAGRQSEGFDSITSIAYDRRQKRLYALVQNRLVAWNRRRSGWTIAATLSLSGKESYTSMACCNNLLSFASLRSHALFELEASYHSARLHVVKNTPYTQKGVSRQALSPSGQWLAVSREPSNAIDIIRIDLKSLKAKRLCKVPHTVPIRSMLWHEESDGEGFLCTTSYDGMSRVWCQVIDEEGLFSLAATVPGAGHLPTAQNETLPLSQTTSKGSAVPAIIFFLTAEHAKETFLATIRGMSATPPRCLETSQDAITHFETGGKSMTSILTARDDPLRLSCLSFTRRLPSMRCAEIGYPPTESADLLTKTMPQMPRRRLHTVATPSGDALVVFTTSSTAAVYEIAFRGAVTDHRPIQLPQDEEFSFAATWQDGCTFACLASRRLKVFGRLDADGRPTRECQSVHRCVNPQLFLAARSTQDSTFTYIMALDSTGLAQTFVYSAAEGQIYEGETQILPLGEVSLAAAPNGQPHYVSRPWMTFAVYDKKEHFISEWRHPYRSDGSWRQLRRFSVAGFEIRKMAVSAASFVAFATGTEIFVKDMKEIAFVTNSMQSALMLRNQCTDLTWAPDCDLLAVAETDRVTLCSLSAHSWTATRALDIMGTYGLSIDRLRWLSSGPALEAEGNLALLSSFMDSEELLSKLAEASQEPISLAVEAPLMETLRFGNIAVAACILQALSGAVTLELPPLSSLFHQSSVVHAPRLEAFAPGTLLSASLSVAANATAQLVQHCRTVDMCGMRYLVNLWTGFKGLTYESAAWASHSDSGVVLMSEVRRAYDGRITLNVLSNTGLAFWLRDSAALASIGDTIAKTEFTNQATGDREPILPTLIYLAMKKKHLAITVWRQAIGQADRSSVLQFLQNDFDESRWRSAALKNAFVLLSKKRFILAACFFLLGQSVADAAAVLSKQVGSLSLATLVLRLYEGAGAGPDKAPFMTYLESILLPHAFSTGSRWLVHWTLWELGKRDLATKSLLVSLPTLAGELGVSYQVQDASPDPAYLYLYEHLRSFSLQTLKGRLAVSGKTEYDFVLYTCRLLRQRGCHHLALSLAANWQFDQEPTSGRARSETGSDARRRPMPRRKSTMIDMVVPSVAASRAQTPTPEDGAPNVKKDMSDEHRLGDFKTVLRQAKKDTTAPPEFDINSFSF